jgi:hypothetical protein
MTLWVVKVPKELFYILVVVVTCKTNKLYSNKYEFLLYINYTSINFTYKKTSGEMIKLYSQYRNETKKQQKHY